MSNTTVDCAKAISSANTSQQSQGLFIQTYCNSVKEQPNVDFSKLPDLKSYETEINTALATAQGHADTYLNSLQTSIITNLADIENYYNLHQAVATTLPPGSSKSSWLQALQAVKAQSDTYQTNASNLATSIGNFASDLATDAGNFNSIVTDLNSAVNGSNGELATLNQELDAVNSAINTEIGEIVGSSLGIVGGIVMVAVGAACEFETGGLSSGLIVGGAGLIVAGIAGDVAAGIALNNNCTKKGNLLTEIANLTEEVKLTSAMGTAYTSLSNNVSTAVTDATQMENAWSNISADLGTLSSDLQNGIINTNEIRTLWLTDANAEIQTVLADIQTIKAQMAGVQQVPVTGTNTFASALLNAVTANAA